MPWAPFELIDDRTDEERNAAHVRMSVTLDPNVDILGLHFFGPGDVWLRVRREGDDCVVDSSRDGRGWEQIRLAHLHEGRGAPVACGPYACSPKGAGFVAEFRSLTIDRGRPG